MKRTIWSWNWNDGSYENKTISLFWRELELIRELKVYVIVKKAQIISKKGDLISICLNSTFKLAIENILYDQWSYIYLSPHIKCIGCDTFLIFTMERFE